MYYCIVNPSAHSGDGARLWNIFATKFHQKGIDYIVTFTQGPGHAQTVVSDIIQKETNASPANPIKLVVLGGDGTMNEIISGIHDFDNVLIGFLPVGSSNDLSRDLSLPGNPEKIMDTILSGKLTRRLDVGHLHYDSMTQTMSRLHSEVPDIDHYFAVSAGIGFDAAICEEALSSGLKNALNKINLGKLAYSVIALHQIANVDKISCDIELDGQPPVHIDHVFFATIMVHPYEGGGYMFCPDADATDGYFNVCVIGDLSKLKAVMCLPAAHSGKHYGIEGVYHFRAKHIRIRTLLPLWVHTDGEVSVKSDCITLDCLHQKLNLMM